MQEFRAIPECEEASELAAELTLGAHRLSLQRLPKTEERKSGGLLLRIPVASTDPGVAPHFPGKQLIAGYMQVDWISQVVSAIWPGRGVWRIEDCKFLGAITPPTEVELELRFAEDSDRLDVVLREDGAIRTKARVSLSAVK